MIPEELKKRLVGALILIAVFMIAVPVFISGKNVNRDQRLLEQIERHHASMEAASGYSGETSEQAAPVPQTVPQISEPEPKKPAARPAPGDLDNVRIVDDHRETGPVSQQPKENRKPEPARNDSRTVAQKPAPKQEPVRQPPKQESRPQLKNTVTVINQQTKRTIEVPVKQPKPDPNYIYDGGKKIESSPITTKNPITGNIERYELNAGAYSTMTAARNLEQKIKKYCGVTRTVPVMNQSTRVRMFRVICGNSTNVSELQRIQNQIKPYVSAQLQKVK